MTGTSEKNTGNIRKIPNELFFEHVLSMIGEGENVTIMVSGHSMTPTFVDAVDKIVISPFDADSLKVGDVVLFDRGDQLCVHRIIERNGDDLVIRGDGNSLTALEKVKVGAVKGLITGGTMKGGKPFTINDPSWTRQTEFIRKYAKPLAKWHRLKSIASRYPFSIIVLCLLLFLSFMNTSGFSLPKAHYADKWGHFIMYLGTSCVFWLEWLKSHRLDRPSVLKGSLFCVLFPILLGGLIEVGQNYLTVIRSGEMLDFIANTVGVLVGIPLSLHVLYPLCVRLKNKGSR